MRILVVDDQKTLGMALCGILERLGHEPRFANSGAAAWEILNREDWRLVITDWVMPDLDGLELCRRIRGRQGAAYIYLIILTARSGLPSRVEGLRAGADDFLTQPVDEDELTIRLEIASRILAVQDEMEEKRVRLHELATTDHLTGLANRRQLNEAMGGSIRQANHGIPCSLVALDIDHFKSYNDTYGHPAGDAVLQAVGGILEAGTRSCDLVARTGGEEFVIVLPGLDLNEATIVAERLRIAIAGHSWPSRPITASFGVTAIPPMCETSSMIDFFESADRALYRSKRSGRNRVTRSHRIGEASAKHQAPSVAAIC